MIGMMVLDEVKPSTNAPKTTRIMILTKGSSKGSDL